MMRFNFECGLMRVGKALVARCSVRGEHGIGRWKLARCVRRRERRIGPASPIEVHEFSARLPLYVAFDGGRVGHAWFRRPSRAHGATCPANRGAHQHENQRFVHRLTFRLFGSGFIPNLK